MPALPLAAAARALPCEAEAIMTNAPSTGKLQPSPEDEPKSDAPDHRGITASTVDGEKAPRLPHERDESSDGGTGAPSEIMHIAHDDAQSDKQPSDKGEATDATYARNLRGPTPGAERDDPS